MNKLLLLLLMALPALALFDEDEQQVLQVPVEVRHVVVKTVHPKPSVDAISLHVYGQVESSANRAVTSLSDGLFKAVVQSGDTVKKGETIGYLQNHIRATNITNLRTEITLLREQITLSKQEIARNKEMLKMGLVGENALYVLRNELNQKRVTLQQREHQLKLALLNESAQTVRASDDAIILSVATSGSYLPIGAVVATLTSTRAIVRLFVEPFFAQHIQSGQAVVIESTNQTFPSHIETILPISRANLTEIIAYAPPSIPIGTNVEASIALKGIKGYIVPKSAIVLFQNRPAVFLLELAHAKMKFVTVEKDMIDSVLLSDTFKKEDQVISTNAYMLQDGATVEVEK